MPSMQMLDLALTISSSCLWMKQEPTHPLRNRSVKFDCWWSERGVPSGRRDYSTTGLSIRISWLVGLKLSQLQGRRSHPLKLRSLKARHHRLLNKYH